MASKKSSMPILNTTRHLEYVKSITKIPELGKITNLDYMFLPCANQYSLIILYENPYDLLGTIYGIKNLRQKVLLHIKQNRKYYQEVSKSYLASKKLDLIHWLGNMMTNNLPADELFLHAICTYMNLHVIVDFIGGIWTTLDIPNIKHDLAISLSDVHLAYRGFYKYGLLYKNIQLKTIGKKLMDYKIQKNQNTLITQTSIVSLGRVEELNTLAEKLLNEELSSLELSKQDKYSKVTKTSLDSDDT